MGVGASVGALLMLRGEFKVFLLCVDGNVFVASVECRVLWKNSTKKKKPHILCIRMTGSFEMNT